MSTGRANLGGGNFVLAVFEISGKSKSKVEMLC